jgi:MFS family permease
VHILRSLRHSSYRLYFIGQLVSMNGTWMQNVAQAWLVYRLTQSSFMLGLVAFFGTLPMLLFGLLGGVVADRLSRRKLLMGAQVLAMSQAATLGVLTLTGLVQVWHILVLAATLGLVHAFETPARHSFVAELVPREDLSNAIALNAGLFNLARFLGPAIAGLLVALLGEGPVFLVNAGTFLVLLMMLLAIRLPGALERPAAGSTLTHLGEGLRFAWGHAPIRAGLMVVALVGLVGAPHVVLMPVFAQEVFGGGPKTLGMLLGAVGAGALAGALRLAQRVGTTGLERVIGSAGVLAGLMLLALSAVPALWLALPVLAALGFALTTVFSTSNAFIQLAVPDRLRGRIMALFSVIFLGLMPIGSLASGSLAHLIGAPATVGVFGVLCLVGAAVFLWRRPALPQEPRAQSGPSSAVQRGQVGRAERSRSARR